MRVAHGVGRAAGAGGEGLGGCDGNTIALDASCDQVDLLLGVADGPILAGLADDFDLLEQRALIPTLADGCDFALAVESYNVVLEKNM
jgi:hypothetical protein